MITIKQLTSKSDLKKFVTFPFKLYKDSKYWVPSLIKDEMETLDSEKNPVFKNETTKGPLVKILKKLA